jgi:hypothetical protein
MEVGGSMSRRSIPFERTATLRRHELTRLETQLQECLSLSDVIAYLWLIHARARATTVWQQTEECRAASQRPMRGLRGRE